MFLDNQDFDFWGYWLASRQKNTVLCMPIACWKVIQPFLDALVCIFHWLSAYGSFFFSCWDFRIGVRVCLWEVSVYGRFSMQSFLKKWPGPQIGVHLWEVSSYGKCPLVGVWLYLLLGMSYASQVLAIVCDTECNMLNWFVHRTYPWPCHHSGEACRTEKYILAN